MFSITAQKDVYELLKSMNYFLGPLLLSYGWKKIFTISHIPSLQELKTSLLTHLSSKNYPIPFHIKANVENIVLRSILKEKNL